MNIFHSKKPFDHWVIDGFYKDKKLIESVLHDFEKVCHTRSDWWEYNNPFEKKLAFDKFFELPGSLQHALSILNSTQIIMLLEELTGVKGLVADPHFRGGGLHRIKPGGYLHIHRDFNIHPTLQMIRKINVIVYLNPVWDESWGGCLELWKKDMSAIGSKILPIINRAVIFDTEGESFHGHPDPITGPKERWSLAAYYYVANVGNDRPHSTLYRRRPNDPIIPEVEELRLIRGKGRLQPVPPSQG